MYLVHGFGLLLRLRLYCACPVLSLQGGLCLRFVPPPRGEA